MSLQKKTGLWWNKTRSVWQQETIPKLVKAWEEITGNTTRVFSKTIDPDLSRSESERLEKQMAECLYHKGGEVSARRKTIELGKYYFLLSDKGKERFLTLLAEKFDINSEAVLEKLKQFPQEKNTLQQSATLAELIDLLEAPRVKILRQFNSLPEGIKFIVDLREDLLRFKKQTPSLNMLEADLRRLLASWFDIGLLDMQEITWNSPAALLEKLIRYEAVHAIASWGDLKNRLDSDRRCFAFFHHKMPGEPLIFVEVALVEGMPSSIQVLLDENAPAIDIHRADTAVFYSISNAQAGLAGISFGNFLIKRVVDKLSAELNNLKYFVTLSPIPGFRKWLDPILKSGDETLFSAAEAKQLIELAKQHELQVMNSAKALYHLLELPEWSKKSDENESLKKILMRLCAHYLLEQKKDHRALDPVAHFHLSNGARMERLNWMADISKKGIKQSAGMMVNYLYHLPKIEDHHEAYSSGKAIAASNEIKLCLKK